MGNRRRRLGRHRRRVRDRPGARRPQSSRGPPSRPADRARRFAAEARPAQPTSPSRRSGGGLRAIGRPSGIGLVVANAAYASIRSFSQTSVRLRHRPQLPGRPAPRPPSAPDGERGRPGSSSCRPWPVAGLPGITTYFATRRSGRCWPRALGRMRPHRVDVLACPARRGHPASPQQDTARSRHRHAGGGRHRALERSGTGAPYPAASWDSLRPLPSGCCRVAWRSAHARPRAIWLRCSPAPRRHRIAARHHQHAAPPRHERTGRPARSPKSTTTSHVVDLEHCARDGPTR